MQPDVPLVFLLNILKKEIHPYNPVEKGEPDKNDDDGHELERQNKITKQILEAFIQKKLGLASNNYRAPSIFDILPGKTSEERPTRQSTNERLRQSEPEGLPVNGESVSEDEEVNANEERAYQDGLEYVDIDALQSVESEQIDSIYSEGN
ncbi:unnamed protein product [Leptosia nina]|uniref:Uncharacterized protein n=1 Tax=Leptosia nina TaxID=320188 RepID=A0AAV1J6E9_9NEOP